MTPKDWSSVEANHQYSMKEVSEILKKELKIKIGRNRLMKFLRLKGLLDEKNFPTDACKGKNYFTIISDNTMKWQFTTNTTRVSSKGLRFIKKLLQKEYENKKSKT